MPTLPPTMTDRERDLLAAARGGDEDAFAGLVAPYRAALHAHCYRMLGSLPDAEDALQETLLRAWRGLPRFEGRSSLRSWLYTIATNACLKAIERRPRRVLPLDYGGPGDPADGPGRPLIESVWIDPYPDHEVGLEDGLAAPDARYEQRESVELAFIAALQQLPVRQRAVLILRDVLGLSGAETAAALGTTPASVYSALQRAHRTLDQRRLDRSQQATLRALGDPALAEIVDAYVDAWERRDIDAVIAMLTEDAVLAMPPFPAWFRGRADIAAFLAAWPFAPGVRWRVVAIRANGQVAFAHYRWDEERGGFHPHGISVLTLAGQRIAEITAFLDASTFPAFGLPAQPAG
ncbi:MAG TPA: sigma-70 family RNA polymerase sigma factor [Gaiellales bacterium]|nr:sigma-70 family RNA polymerase sigma factor [Gaiellales bacterium]